MLSKSSRLNRVEFLVVKNTGQSIRHPQISFRYLNSPTNKVAIVTSTKLSKSSVVRNRLRRQIYSYFEKYPISAHVIIYPTTQMLNLSSEEIATLLDKTLPTHSGK